MGVELDVHERMFAYSAQVEAPVVAAHELPGRELELFLPQELEAEPAAERVRGRVLDGRVRVDGPAAPLRPRALERQERSRRSRGRGPGTPGARPSRSRRSRRAPSSRPSRRPPAGHDLELVRAGHGIAPVALGDLRLASPGRRGAPSSPGRRRARAAARGRPRPRARGGRRSVLARRRPQVDAPPRPRACRSPASSSGAKSRLSSAPRLSSSCSTVRAPISAEVMRGSRSTQAIAICASVWPRPWAISLSARTRLRFSSVRKLSFRNVPSAAREFSGTPSRYFVGQHALAERREDDAADALLPQHVEQVLLDPAVEQGVAAAGG